jgi:hypothetical protein
MRTPISLALNRFAPHLQPLEGRDCASASHTLVIHGDAAPSQINVIDDGHGDVTATVSSAGHSSTTHAAGVDHLMIYTGSNQDRVNVTATGVQTSALLLDVRLKTGDQRVSLDFGRGVSAPLTVLMRGGDGNDQLDVNVGTVYVGGVDLHAWLGAGDNRAAINLNGDIAFGSRVLVDLNGGADDDSLGVSAHGRIDATSKVDVRLNGGAGEDWLRTNYQGKLDGQLRIRADGGADRDTLSTRLSVARGSTGKLDVQTQSSGGLDVSTLSLTDDSRGGVSESLLNFGTPVHARGGVAYSQKWAGA